MKQLLFIAALLFGCVAAQAQSLTIKNNTGGDMYFKVHTAQNNTCTLLTEYLDFMVPAYTGVLVDLTDPANWNGGMIPTSFDLLYAEASRNPACPGTAPWSALSGTCGANNMYYDVVTVGNSTTCLYIAQACAEMSVTGTCGGFVAGDVADVTYTTVGVDVTIDIN